MDAPQSLLISTAEEGARRVALVHLESAARARDRIEDPEDTEALHDLRVALRRLRSVMRAYRPQLEGSVSGKLRRRLRELAGATGGARDTEVQLEWLDAQRAALGERYQGGLDFLTARLQARKQEAYVRVRAGVAEELDRVSEKLARKLMVYTQDKHLDGSRGREIFAQTTARLLREHAAQFRDQLAAVHSAHDEVPAHEARIAAKRLRYLLEPLRGLVSGCEGTVARLKALQDLLGELHDAVVMAAEVGKALEDASMERARRLHEQAMRQPAAERGAGETSRDPRPGLLALARLARQKRDERFGVLARDWLGGGAEAFFAELDGLAAALGRDAPQPARLERRYLLRSLPTLPPEVESLEVDEGSLPGQSGERLRHERGAGWSRCMRTVSVAGVADEPVLVEEEIAEALFRALWPHTRGSRARVRLHRFYDGVAAWEILDRGDSHPLWARVRFPPGTGVPTAPAWLQAVIAREITEELGFLSARLAAR